MHVKMAIKSYKKSKGAIKKKFLDIVVEHWLFVWDVPGLITGRVNPRISNW